MSKRRLKDSHATYSPLKKLYQFILLCLLIYYNFPTIIESTVELFTNLFINVVVITQIPTTNSSILYFFWFSSFYLNLGSYLRKSLTKTMSRAVVAIFPNFTKPLSSMCFTRASSPSSTCSHSTTKVFIKIAKQNN